MIFDLLLIQESVIPLSWMTKLKFSKMTEVTEQVESRGALIYYLG